MKHKQPDERTILKAVERGDFSNCYLTYNRKSLDEPNSQKNSLKYQKVEIARFVQREQVVIARDVTIEGFCKSGAISEKHSGFKESDDLIITDKGYAQYQIERPKFQRLLQHLSRGQFKGVVCLCWDRMSRNQGDDTIIRKLMRKGIDVRFVYANYDNSSAGQLHMDVDGMFAQHHSRVTSEKVAASTRNLREQGKCTYRAPIGYLNKGGTDHKPCDPERAPVITEMFKLYATGNWSLSDLARHANQQGFTTVPMRRRRTKEEILADDDDDDTQLPKLSRPITENHVSRILKREFYTGKVLGADGIYIPSTSHEALIDEDTFNQVQFLLKRKTVSVHYTEKLDHPLRGIVRCSYCNRVYTPYTKKGHLYFNARCLRGCKNRKKNVNFDFISGKFRKLIADLHFTDDELEEFNAKTRTDFVLLQEKQETEFDRIEREKKRIRADLKYLRDQRLELLKTGVYSPEDIVSEQRGLETKLKELSITELASEEAMRELVEDIVLLSELLKMALPLYDAAKPREKETIIRIIFSELFVAQNTLSFNVKRGFEPLVDRKYALCDPIAWLSEHGDKRISIQANVEKLKILMP